MATGTHLTADVVLLLPARLRRAAVQAGTLFADRMARAGHPSAFRLGAPFPQHGPDAVCEPHVSLFMLRLNPDDVGQLMSSLRATTAALVPPRARGAVWRHNPYGAPELHFEKSSDWQALQGAVVAAAEPLRHGLREQDPAGASPAAEIDRLRRDAPDSPQLHQLERYGYDEVADEQADRFSPHVTVAWPQAPYRVELAGAGPATGWDVQLSRLAVFGMAPFGTCVRLLGEFRLGQAVTARRSPGWSVPVLRR